MNRRNMTPDDALDRWFGRACLFIAGAAFVMIDLLAGPN